MSECGTTKCGCGCPCHKMSGILIAVFGLSFLLKNGGVITDEIHNWIWPCLIFVAGLSKVCSGFCKCCKPKQP